MTAAIARFSESPPRTLGSSPCFGSSPALLLADVENLQNARQLMHSCRVRPSVFSKTLDPLPDDNTGPLGT